MSVRGASINAYRGVNVTASQRRVLDFLAKYPRRDWTRNELATMSGIAINSICGRVSELIELGVLQELGLRPCKFSGRRAHPLLLLPTQQTRVMEQAA